MKLKIVKIIDRGVVDKERLWLKVLQDTDMEYHIVFDTTYTSQDSISNLLRHAYWFRSKHVRSGDSVVLYTKGGDPSSKQNTDGTTTHFFYWGLDKTIWNREGDCAVVFDITGWVTSAYE
jgi:hypothetical protein